MLFKLSIQNIKKSFKDYAIYFFTLILGVAIFYVFNAIESQTVLMNVSNTTHELINLMMNMMSFVSVFVAFILGFLIIYASRFLMKRRKKEFGVYLTLGMSKQKISKILFLETILIGILSLGVGLFIGIGLSQIMSVLVANLFEADMTEFTFVFSKASMIKTMICFGIVYFIVMIFNTISVGKCKLMDLLYASKKSESVKMRNPLLCVIVFLISAIFLGYAYYMVTGNVRNLDNSSIGILIVIGIITTFFIIWSLSGLILRIVRKFPKFYYRKLNSFTIRELSSKINTTVFSMGFITIMLFITICVLSSALSIKNSMTDNLKTLSPVDLIISKNVSKKDNITNTDLEAQSLTVLETLEKANVSTKNMFHETLELYTYQTSAFTFQDFLGEYHKEVLQTFPFMRFDTEEEIVRISDYNKIANLYHLPTYQIEDDEYILVADYDALVDIRNKSLERNKTIQINDKKLTSKYNTVQNGFLYIAPNKVNPGFYIVPDHIVSDNMKTSNLFIANYDANQKSEKQEKENRILSLSENTYLKSLKTSQLNFSTRISIYEASVGLSAMVTFIGIYLGIIFLISSAALLALKQLSDSADNQEHYKMLRKIGTDEKMIQKALFRQIGVFYFFPLLFAMIHSIFGIQFCNNIIAVFGKQQLLNSIIMTAVILVVIYGGYFLITYYCSKNILKEKN